jgi:hypothetical protein
MVIVTIQMFRIRAMHVLTRIPRPARRAVVACVSKKGNNQFAFADPDLELQP